MKNNYSTNKWVFQNTKRIIYILPNLFTSASLFAGFYSIIATFNSHFTLASMYICIAAIIDSLDGRVARLTNTQSLFGAEYDSLTDIVSFGVAPALIIYFWTLSNLEQCGWIIAFIYLICVGLRLARFNIQLSYIGDSTGSKSKDYFIGLPCPAAAVTIAGFVSFCNSLGYTVSVSWIMYVGILMIAYLSTMMVSNIKFRSFKDYRLKEKMVFIQIVFIGIAVIIIFTDPAVILFIVFILYSLSGAIFQISRK